MAENPTDTFSSDEAQVVIHAGVDKIQEAYMYTQKKETHFI